MYNVYIGLIDMGTKYNTYVYIYVCVCECVSILAAAGTSVIKYNLFNVYRCLLSSKIFITGTYEFFFFFVFFCNNIILQGNYVIIHILYTMCLAKN